MRVGGRIVHPSGLHYGALFEPFISEMMGAVAGPVVDSAFNFIPSGDMIDSGEAYLVRVELPGVAKENVKTELKGDFLIISGEKRDEYAQEEPKGTEGSAEKDKEKPVRRQKFGWTSYGSFVRQLMLPKDANRQAISASLKDGILTVTIPKTEPTITDVPISITVDE